MDNIAKEKLCLLLEKLVQRQDVIDEAQCELIGSVAQMRDTQHDINNALQVIKSSSQLDQEELVRLHRRLDGIVSTLNKISGTQDQLVAKHNNHVIGEYVGPVKR